MFSVPFLALVDHKIYVEFFSCLPNVRLKGTKKRTNLNDTPPSPFYLYFNLTTNSLSQIDLSLFLSTFYNAQCGK